MTGQERAEATKGPWREQNSGDQEIIERQDANGGWQPHFYSADWYEDLGSYFGRDARFVSAIRNAAPSLISELRRLRKVEEVAREEAYRKTKEELWQ